MNPKKISKFFILSLTSRFVSDTYDDTLLFYPGHKKSFGVRVFSIVPCDVLTSAESQKCIAYVSETYLEVKLKIKKFEKKF